MTELRKAVLNTFKKLHRTRLHVFNGDIKTLIAARTKINEEFKKNKDVSDKDSIKAMVKFGEDVEQALRTQVIQAKQVKPGVFEARLTSDTVKLDNVLYNDDAVPVEGTRRNPKPCCQTQSEKGSV